MTIIEAEVYPPQSMTFDGEDVVRIHILLDDAHDPPRLCLFLEMSTGQRWLLPAVFRVYEMADE